jgi:hypothetical protein
MSKIIWASLIDEKIYGQSYIGPVQTRHTYYIDAERVKWFFIMLPCISSGDDTLFSRSLVAREEDLTFDD